MIFFFIHLYTYEVIFIDPVVNLCSEKLSTYGTATQALYDEQPFSGSDGAYDCMRTAQALCNEVGTVIAWDKKTHEMCVELHHCIIDHNGVEKFPQFWCWDSHVMQHDSDKELKKNKNKKYLVLRQPFFDTQRKVAYSAGTRFARVPQKDTEDGYTIQFFAPELKKNITRVAPRESVVIPDTTLSCAERRLACRDLLRSWITGCDEHSGSGIIPYVWGGASYVNRLPDEKFEKQEGLFFDQATHFWVRPSHDAQQAYGFDCSSLILRAAHIVGIPYYYKTSHAAFTLGTVINDVDKVSVGDVLVWPGHMMMISDLKNGLLIESKGYGAGFGKVQEVHLSRRFKGITSYKKLFKAYKWGLPLYELDADGSVLKMILQYKIISLCGGA